MCLKKSLMKEWLGQISSLDRGLLTNLEMSEGHKGNVWVDDIANIFDPNLLPLDLF